MAGNKKPRKAHAGRARWKGLPISIRFDSACERDLQLYPHAELSKLRDGVATAEAWHTIVARLNVGQVTAHRHFTNEAQKACRTALDSMVCVRERHARVGKWGISGDEFATVGAALNLTDDMQLNSTRRELAGVMNHVNEVAAVLTGELK